jgi:hypothetical protein
VYHKNIWKYKRTAKCTVLAMILINIKLLGVGDNNLRGNTPPFVVFIRDKINQRSCIMVIVIQKYIILQKK